MSNGKGSPTAGTTVRRSECRAEKGAMEYSPGTPSWRTVLYRSRALLPTRLRRPTLWSALVPVVALLTGLLVSTSAHTAQGTALRDDRTPQLTSLIADRNRQIEQLSQQESTLRSNVEAKTNAVAGSDADTARQQARGDTQRAAAGHHDPAQRRAQAPRREPAAGRAAGRRRGSPAGRPGGGQRAVGGGCR